MLFFRWRSPVRTERVSTSERTQYASKTLFSLITAPIRFKTIELSEATHLHKENQNTSILSRVPTYGSDITRQSGSSKVSVREISLFPCSLGIFTKSHVMPTPQGFQRVLLISKFLKFLSLFTSNISQLSCSTSTHSL